MPEPVSPSLRRVMDGFASGSELWKISSSAQVNDNAFESSRELINETLDIKTIVVLFDNLYNKSHPIHLRGYRFWILAAGADKICEQDIDAVSLENPLRRDTASLNPYSWLLIRFIVYNPGLWTLNSANLWHIEAGLSMQFLTRAKALSKVEVPAKSNELCESL